MAGAGSTTTVKESSSGNGTEVPEMRNGKPSSVVWFVFSKGTSLGELEGKVKAPAVFGV